MTTRYNFNSQLISPTHGVNMYTTYDQIDRFVKERLSEEDLEKFNNCKFMPYSIKQTMDGVEVQLMPVLFK